MGFFSGFVEALRGSASLDGVLDPKKRLKIYGEILQKDANKEVREVLQKTKELLANNVDTFAILNSEKIKGAFQTAPEAWLNTVLSLRDRHDLKSYADIKMKMNQAIGQVKRKIPAAEAKYREFLMAIERDASTLLVKLHSVEQPKVIDTMPADMPPVANNNEPVKEDTTPGVKDAA